MKYIKRTTAPSKKNDHYYKNNPFEWSGYGIPNCTAYAWGRFYEITGKKPTLSLSNAENWFTNTKDGYKRGQVPKVGSVICWRRGKAGVSSDGAGHVAIVEEVLPNGDINTSNSAWKSTEFYMKKLKAPYYYMGSEYVFQGFIYPPVEFDESNSMTDTYIVKQGDTLAAIGRIYGFEWEELAEYNKMTDKQASEIHAGDTIKIPPKKNETDVPNENTINELKERIQALNKELLTNKDNLLYQTQQNDLLKNKIEDLYDKAPRKIFTCERTDEYIIKLKKNAILYIKEDEL